MAGDWIKIEHTLPGKPEVSRIAEMLNLSEDDIIGKLIKLWVWADQHTPDGHAVSVTQTTLDRRVSCSGFADALRKVGWLEGRDAALSFPHFTRHNGQSAKKRAQERDRKESERSRKCHAPSVTESGLEKRREENIGERERVRVREPDPELLLEDREEMDPDRVRLVESVLSAYPANGNAMEASRALAGIHASDSELRAILAKTQGLAAKYRALPESERRFCPRKHTFFAERRWNDNPADQPWTAAPAVAGNSKPKASHAPDLSSSNGW